MRSARTVNEKYAGMSAADAAKIACEMLAGKLARMPARMMSEMPLPMPNSVTSSPSHMRSNEPAATSAIFATSATEPKCAMTP